MDMSFCRGCGKEMHATALSCPHCGFSASKASVDSNEGFMDLALMPLKKYATFTGRARRKEYWFFFLLYIVIAFAIGFFEGLVSGSSGVIGNLLALALLIPSVAVGVRRMHDIDRSGWWVILPIVNLVFFCFEGNKGENRFGLDPKG